MIPAGKEQLKCFAVRRGQIEGRFNPSYFASGYQHLLRKLQTLPHVRKLGSLIQEGAFGILPPGNSYLESGGIRFLRATELLPNNEISWDTCLRVPEKFGQHERAKIKAGDVLLAVKGATIASDKSVCSIEEISELTIVNGSIFRFQPNAETCSLFLCSVLTSDFAKKQMKGSMILNNAVDYLSRRVIDDLLIPLPDLNIQKKIVAEMEQARKARRKKLQQVDELLDSLDEWLMEKLGLIPATADERTIFALRLEQLKGHRIDVPAYRPFFAKSHPPKTPLASLSDLAYIDSHVIRKPEDENELIPYVGLPECEQTEVREVVMRPYHEVKGRSVVKPGDILFARIEPSIFNKKYVFVEDLKGHEYAYTSTEFYVVTPNYSEADPHYLYAMFFSSFVFNQVKGKTTGSSGRRRLDPELFRSLQFPKPSMKMQQTIATEVRRRREEARRLRAEAAAEWENAKISFEEKLLGNRG